MPETTWTIGDEAVLWAVSLGMALQPWQIGFMARSLPEPFSPLPEREDHT